MHTERGGQGEETERENQADSQQSPDPEVGLVSRAGDHDLRQIKSLMLNGLSHSGASKVQIIY